MRIQILSEARDDIRWAYRYYEDRSPGVGRYFRSCIFSDIESLLRYAGIHPVVFGSHRSLAKRFPFAIHYRIEGEIISVIAILDCRRDPNWIKRRLLGG